MFILFPGVSTETITGRRGSSSREVRYKLVRHILNGGERGIYLPGGGKLEQGGER